MADIAPQESTPRRPVKSAAAFRTISEVSGELDVPAHVLRFWESKFSQIHPLKRGGGRRYYRPEDITVLRRIRDLLYTDGYTIKGVQKLLREGGGKNSDGGSTRRVVDIVGAAGADTVSARTQGPDPALRRELRGILGDLESMRDLLRQTPD